MHESDQSFPEETAVSSSEGSSAEENSVTHAECSQWTRLQRPSSCLASSFDEVVCRKKRKEEEKIRQKEEKKAEQQRKKEEKAAQKRRQAEEKKSRAKATG